MLKQRDERRYFRMNKLLIAGVLILVVAVGALFAAQPSDARTSKSGCLIADAEGNYVIGSGAQCNQACGIAPTGTGCTVATCVQAAGVACIYQCDTLANPSVWLSPGAVCSSGACSAAGTSCQP